MDTKAELLERCRGAGVHKHNCINCGNPIRTEDLLWVELPHCSYWGCPVCEKERSMAIEGPINAPLGFNVGVSRQTIHGLEVTVCVYSPDGAKSKPMCQQVADAALAYSEPVVRSYLEPLMEGERS